MTVLDETIEEMRALYTLAPASIASMSSLKSINLGKSAIKKMKWAASKPLTSLNRPRSKKMSNLSNS